MLVGWGWTEGRADRAVEAAALGVSITISYVSGGTHSPLYKVSLSAHASPVAGEYSFSPAFFPPDFSMAQDGWLRSMAEPGGKLKGC